MHLQYYMEQLGYPNIPTFLVKYLKVPSLLRLKNIGYFCGMDYASKDIYNFSEHITRYDHSLTVSLIIYKLTNNVEATIAGLFHDIATPCFSHVIDYMNQDYEKQESTEEYTEYILKNDKYLLECLKIDGIDINKIINFKQFSIVDNERPKVCADRIDGVILTGIGWTKNFEKIDIKNTVQDLCIFKNENHEDEIGFKNKEIANKIVDVSETIDVYCHSKEDNYMMQLLAEITKLAIKKSYFKYEDLYFYTEEKIFRLLKFSDDIQLLKLIYEFENIKRNKIIDIELPKIKIRDLNPLVNGKRVKP